MEDFQQLQQSRTSDQPVRDRKCPQCGSRSETIFQKEASIYTYVLSFISLFFFKFWSIFVIPIIISATQQVAKRCYDCDTIIEKHDLFSVPSVNDQILNFRFGSFAFIVSRKYAYGILGVFVILFTYFKLTAEPEHVATFDDTPILNQELDRTWIQYLKDCGSGVYQDNSVRANSHYMSTYHQNIVTWEGVFLSCWDCPGDFSKMNREYYLKIKMDPTDSDSETYDIILAIDQESNAKNHSIISQLNQLEVVKFKGKFEAIGTNKSFHRLSLISIGTTGRSIDKLEDIKTSFEAGVFD